MTSKNLVSSTSLKLLLVFLVTALALASLPAGQAQLGFPMTDIAPNPDTNQQLTPWGVGTDRMYETANGNQYYFSSNSWWGYWCSSTDGGATWTDLDLGAFPTTATANRLKLGTQSNWWGWVDGNDIHIVSAFRYSGQPSYGEGMFYTKFTSDGSGGLTYPIFNQEIVGDPWITTDNWEAFGAAPDSTGNIIAAWKDADNEQIIFYRQDAGAWNSFNWDYSGRDIRDGSMMVEGLLNSTMRVSIFHDKVADTGDYAVTTFLLKTGGSWDVGQISDLYLLDMDADTTSQYTARSDAGGWFHVVYRTKLTDEIFHATIAQGTLLSNTLWRATANLTQMSLGTWGTHGLILVQFDQTSRKIHYYTFNGNQWTASRTLAHYDATTTWGGPVIPKYWPTNKNWDVVFSKTVESPDGAYALGFDFGPSDLLGDEVAPPPVPAWGDVAPAVDFGEMEGWLFEYEDYHLTAQTAYVNTSLSWSFQLKGGNWNATYNRTAGTVTATSSEDIEVVRAITTGTLDLLNWDFHILLTQNMPDQYDVPIYVKASGPYGNLNWTLVSVVDIYNEGGATNYSFVGWSGHETGDHPFEVFSADTRTPTLIDLYNFDVRSEPLTVNLFESSLLSEMRADWLIHLPYRDTDADIYPTHRLASYADASDRGYVSYPFSLYVEDQAVDAGRQLYLEKEFRRVIKTSMEELVTVQWYAMNPDTDQQAGQYRIQTQSIKRTGSANYAVQMRFDSADEIDVWNITGGGTWDTLVAAADYDWYKIRCELNMTSQTVDFYVGDVFQASAPFAEECNKLGAFFIGTINSVTTLNRFYTDDVWAYTDFDLALGGIADVSQTYRKLRSWNMHLGYGIESPDGVRDGAMEQGYIEFGVDYVFGTAWVPELSVRITPNATDLSARNNWIKYKVEWNHTSTGEIIKTDYIFGLYEADPKLGVDFLQRELTSLFADLWVDQANSSSVVGGRLNVEWYGISDKAPWYQFWGQEWKPKITDVDRSQILMPLMDENGTIRQAYEIKLCRIWARSFRTDYGTFHHKITQISQFDTNEVLGFNRFEGQDTPFFNEPKTPSMSNAGLFGPVYALIGAIGNAIVTAMISGANGFIGLADSLLVFLGIETGFFHTIITFLGLIPTYIIDLMLMVGSALDQLLGVIVPVFELVTFVMTFGLVFLGQLVSKQLEFWRLVVDIFQGGAGMPFNFWVDFNLQAFFTLALVMLPVTLYDRWSVARDPMATAQADISFAMTTAEFILGLYGTIVEILTNLVDLILQLVPT